MMKKPDCVKMDIAAGWILAILPAIIVVTSCGTGSFDFTAPLSGRFGHAYVAVKSFEVISTVSASSVETHRAGPLGFTRSVEGSKITYADLMLEAARLDADDIIDVRIDMHTSGRTTFFDWLKGWQRSFTHTGQALAIRYINESEAEETAVEFFDEDNAVEYDLQELSNS